MERILGYFAVNYNVFMSRNLKKYEYFSDNIQNVKHDFELHFTLVNEAILLFPLFLVINTVAS